MIDHVQLTDRMDEGLVLLHLRSSIPVWELLYLSAKVRSAVHPANQTRTSVLQQKCLYQGKGSGVGIFTMRTCRMAKEAGDSCRRLVTAEMLSHVELAAVRVRNALDEWLWARALERYHQDRCEIMTLKQLGESDLARLVSEFDDLNRAFQRTMCKGYAITAERQSACGPWLFTGAGEDALVPIEGRDPKAPTPTSGRLRPIPEKYQSVFEHDELARKDAFSERSRTAWASHSHLLLRTFYQGKGSHAATP